VDGGSAFYVLWNGINFFLMVRVMNG